jgi:hypothetical protein
MKMLPRANQPSHVAIYNRTSAVSQSCVTHKAVHTTENLEHRRNDLKAKFVLLLLAPSGTCSAAEDRRHFLADLTY